LCSLCGNPWPTILPCRPVVHLRSLADETIHVAGTSLAGSIAALAPLAAWIAIRGLDGLATPCPGACGTVLGGADILYACQDYEFDRKVKPERAGDAGRPTGAAGSDGLSPRHARDDGAVVLRRVTAAGAGVPRRRRTRRGVAGLRTLAGPAR
jgi:hypothetical protein